MVNNKPPPSTSSNQFQQVPTSWIPAGMGNPWFPGENPPFSWKVQDIPSDVVDVVCDLEMLVPAIGSECLVELGENWVKESIQTTRAVILGVTKHYINVHKHPGGERGCFFLVSISSGPISSRLFGGLPRKCPNNSGLGIMAICPDLYSDGTKGKLL